MQRIMYATITLLALVSACTFQPVHDTRSPADATATHVAMEATEVVAATATAVVIEATLEATPAAECLIKGNINSKGEKIFHVPGGANYDTTVVDPDHGEAWFCTEGEAVQAGFRKALR